MGLTVHYTINFNGTQKRLIDKLGTIRNACLDLPFEEVGVVETTKITKNHIKVFNWLQSNEIPNNTDKNLEMRNLILQMIGTNIEQMIQLGEWKHEDKRHWKEQKPTTIVQLPLWPGEGCEASDLIFEKRGKQWICSSFCKTQYATNFVQCHLLVINLFDMLKNEGFEVDIYDEGDYWETRDLKVLGENINESTAMISSMAETFKKHFGAKNMEAPIDNCKNYMKTE